MTVILPVEVNANFNEDEEKISRLNPHLVIFADGEKISFNVDFNEDGHYATFEVDLADLLEAIAKAKREKE